MSAPEGRAALGGEGVLLQEVRGPPPWEVRGSLPWGGGEGIDCECSGWLLQARRQGRPGWSRVSVPIIPWHLGRALKVCGLGFVGLLFRFAVEDPSVPLG